MRRNKGIFIPIKYKFLGVLLSILLVALGMFLFFAQRTFSDDKKLFVMDLNLTLLRAATSEIKLELKSRLEQLQILVPRTLAILNKASDSKDPFEGLSPQLPEEVLAIHFYKKDKTQTYALWKEFENSKLLEKKKWTRQVTDEIQKHYTLPTDHAEKLEMLNHSVRMNFEGKNLDLPVLSFVLSANFVNSDSKDAIVVVDFLQDFLRKKLQQSDIAEVFLISKSGTLLSHGDVKTLVDFASKRFPHPIVDRVQAKHFPRESFELEINGEPFLCNVSETGFPDIFAVSQIKKSEAFLALTAMMRKSFLLALLIVAIATIFSIVFATSLTLNIQKLKRAAQEIGRGNFQVNLKVNTNDEIQSVAESFNIMTEQLNQLVQETASKARMADELETAKLVQSTLLLTNPIQTDAVEISQYYSPASECGGDIWEFFVKGKYLTALIGDATGHGAPAAIITAIAKSYFSTVNSIYQDTVLHPEQLLTLLNEIIYGACKGQILMTMCVVQIDLETGEIKVANAGHESPLCVRNSTGNTVTATGTKKPGAEVFFARGERLGFDPKVTYESKTFQIGLGDTLLLYTDGISEAKNPEGKEYGERALKKSLAALSAGKLEAVKKGLVDGMQGHTKGAPQEDDVTFLLLSWKKQIGIKEAA